MLQINFQKCLKIPTSRLDDFVFKLNLKYKVTEKNFQDKPCIYYATVSFFNKSRLKTKFGRNNQAKPNLTKSLLSNLEALFL